MITASSVILQIGSRASLSNYTLEKSASYEFENKENSSKWKGIFLHSLKLVWIKKY